jgi:hypothetical protein
MWKLWYFFLTAGFCSCSATTNYTGHSETALAIGIREGRISLANTVDEHTTFRISRWESEKKLWVGWGPYPVTNGIVLLRALEGAKPWDGTTGAAAYGLLHVHKPRVMIVLDWSRNKDEQDARLIKLCFGNRLFHYWGDVWEVPIGNYELMDRLFPENKVNTGNE